MTTGSKNHNEELDDDFFNSVFEEIHKENLQFHIPTTPLGKTFIKNLVYANVVETSFDRSRSSKELIFVGKVTQVQLLSALFSSYELLGKLARKFKLNAATMIFPDAVYKFRKKYEQVIPLRSVDSDGTTYWYHEAMKREEDVLTAWQTFSDYHADEIGVFYPNANPSDDEFVEALYSIFKRGPRQEKTELFRLFADLNTTVTSSAINRHCKDIKRFLNDRVKGQPHAIRAIIGSEMKSFRRSSKKLRDIFTFAGPSGVGKTELAKTYAQALCDATPLGFEFRVINMERYSDERSAMALFGSGSQYADSALGELTRHAIAYPRTVYLFDEIEKAHHNVIQSLLTLLDAGEVIDSSALEPAYFSQSIVIFTTNLGQREFSRSQGMGALDIFDVLANAKLHNSDRIALTPELVNRLRAGNAVRFFPLHAHALSSITQMYADNYSSEASGSFSFEFGPNMTALALFSGLPNPVPRAIANTLDTVITRAQHQLFAKFEQHPDDLDQISTIRITAEDELFAPLESRQLLVYVGNNSDDIELFSRSLNASQFAVIEPAIAKKSQITLASYALICIDGNAFDQDELSLLIRRLRDISTQIGVVLLNPSADHLRDESISDYIWQHRDGKFLADDSDGLVNLAKITDFLKIGAQKHLALSYDVEFEDITGSTACFVARDAKLIPQVSAQRADAGVPGLMTRRPSTRLSDVIGLQRAKQEMQRVIGWLEDPSQLQRYNLPMPTGILLLGPPGTGKTLLARAVAGEVDLPFISLNIGEMLSSFANGTATNLQKAFDAARDVAPCVLFIDEIDALASKRSQGENASDRSHNAAVNTLLTQLDGIHKNAEPIFVIAATNFADALDPALTRSGRLDHPILCDLPNSEDRRQFIRFYMTKYNLNFSEPEITSLASQTSGMSGADLEHVFITALYNAVSNLEESEPFGNHPVDATAVRDAITYIRYGAPSSIKLSDEAKLQTATHEAGHLLIQKLLLPHENVTIATVEPRNRALGFISTSRDENQQPQTVAEVKARLAVLMAGREAEQLLYGNSGMNAGASSDLQQATQLAMNAICALGLDDEFGLISYGDKFFQLATLEERQLANERVRFWLNEARAHARELLIKHRSKLESISRELCEKESIYQPEIDAWFA